MPDHAVAPAKRNGAIVFIKARRGRKDNAADFGCFHPRTLPRQRRHLRKLSRWSACVFRGFVDGLTALASDDVRGVPSRPVMLRSRQLVRTMAFLCLPQKLRQRRDVEAESLGRATAA
jgi:hypothetical protein